MSNIEKNQETIYRVSFRTPPEPDSRETDFNFHSLAAIYDRFTEAQIGCKVTHLYNYGIMSGRPYVNKFLTITREPIYRKRRISGSQSVEETTDNETPV